MDNAKIIKEGLDAMGIQTFGGENAPYIWLKTPEDKTSWEFFDWLLETCQIVGTPGAGFGAAGEGYFRLSSFAIKENVLQAVERMKNAIQAVFYRNTPIIWL